MTQCFSKKTGGSTSRNKLKSMNEGAKNLFRKGVGQHGSESTVSYGTFHDTGCYVTGNKGGFMAQHEHTIVVTDGRPLVLTEMNEITSS
jgi:methionine aminopeptidase